MDEPEVWEPKVLSEYEIGRCMSAMLEVALLGKPVVEVMTLRAVQADLEADLAHCVTLAPSRSPLIPKPWVLATKDNRLRYGFYCEPWAFQALQFLDKAELSQFDRDWISGLLFGYTPSAIRYFLEKCRPEPKK